MLDDDIVELFRQKAEAAGNCYQMEINRVLREYLVSGGKPITLDALRQVIREEPDAAWVLREPELADPAGVADR
jgi:hypothetical protein